MLKLKKKSRAKPERHFLNNRRVERLILEALRDHGSLPWSGLYVHFEAHAAGSIGEILHDLHSYEYIIKDSSAMTSITELGLQHLQNSEYWA